MGSLSYLTIDILNSILLQLPVKSLIRFKTTCKSWRCSIDDPDFIKSHLRKSSDNISRQKLLFDGVSHPGSKRLIKIQPREDSISSVSKVFSPNTPEFCRNRFSEVFSCSGLVFVLSYDPGFSMALWNPAVEKYTLIPSPPVIQHKMPMFGFAYDIVSEDYKVLCVDTVTMNTMNPHYVVEIYSVKNQSWRTIHDIFPVKYLAHVYNDQVSLNDVIHRMVDNREECLIISFHLADENFMVTPVPSTCGKNLRLHTMGDDLCVLSTVDKEMLIWSLEKDSKTALLTWNIITRFPTPNWYPKGDWNTLGAVLCVKENGNILFKRYQGPFIEYDVRKNKYIEFGSTELPMFTPNMTLYVESLVSLKIPWD